MMAAAQPFISGAISKTVNMPEEVTVEEVEQLHIDAWRLGLKAIAIYRNNCKVAQPLSAEKKTPEAAAEPAPEHKEWSQKKRLPQVRPAKTFSFRVGESEGYITAGEYPDDGIGEIFLKVSKQGSTLAGLMDAFSIAVSVGLQYGVPLEDYVSKFINMRFEPSGMTNDPDVRFASSLMDLIFRRLAIEYLPEEKRSALGIRTIAERKEAARQEHPSGEPPAAELPASPVSEPAASPVEAGGEGRTEPRQMAVPTAVSSSPTGMEVDAPLCYSCGSKMQPAGSCYVCSSCGSTSGCS